MTWPSSVAILPNRGGLLLPERPAPAPAHRLWTPQGRLLGVRVVAVGWSVAPEASYRGARRGIMARRPAAGGGTPVAATSKTGGGDPNNLTIYTTASVTIASGALLVANVALINGTTGRTCTCTATGLTFTKHGEGLWDTSSDSLSVSSAPCPSGFTGTVTITGSGSCQQANWVILEITNQRASNPVPQVTAVNTGSGNSLSTTALSSPANSTTSRGFMWGAHHNSTTLGNTTTNAPLTELAEGNANSPTTMSAVGWTNASWNTGPFTMDGTNAATVTTWGALAYEVAAA